MFQFAEVGGAVRDKFLGIDSKDVDFVAVPTKQFNTADDAFDALVVHLKEQGFKIFLETPQFFTVRAQVPDGHVLKERTNVADFVISRKDGPSSDGRHPDFVLPGNLMDDLKRRDLTVNAICILDGEVIDPFGGLDDLKNKRLRFVGNPKDRIAEDGLRVMRALRFSVTKELDIDDSTWKQLNNQFAVEMLMKVSIERIREELEKMFFFDTLQSIHIINLLNDCVLDAIFRDGMRLMPTLKK